MGVILSGLYFAPVIAVTLHVITADFIPLLEHSLQTFHTYQTKQQNIGTAWLSPQV